MLPVKFKGKQDLIVASNALANMSPRDAAINLISTDYLKNAKDWAVSHLDECVDCTKYVSSDGNAATLKVEKNTKQYDFFGDNKHRKLKNKLDEAKRNLAEYVAKVGPTHTLTSHYYKSTKV